jgi:hypothetical protein
MVAAGCHRPEDINKYQEIVDLQTQYPAFCPHEIATICFVKFNRKPAPATIKLILASGPKSSTTERRHPRHAEKQFAGAVRIHRRSTSRLFSLVPFVEKPWKV